MWRRMTNRNGIITQPMMNGMRQPQACMVTGSRLVDTIRPISAAKTTAACWLADCHEQKKPFRFGGAISFR